MVCLSWIGFYYCMHDVEFCARLQQVNECLSYPSAEMAAASGGDARTEH
jgi:hypothetical protein